MSLITSNEQLNALLPNIQVTVTGETPLIDKLSPFLAATEKWLSDIFTSEAVFDTICQYAEENALRVATTQAVVYEAFRRAVPHLDIILTPNGFGIVSNTNIAPASKERINRLLDALLENRDAALLQFIHCSMSLRSGISRNNVSSLPLRCSRTWRLRCACRDSRKGAGCFTSLFGKKLLSLSSSWML